MLGWSSEQKGRPFVSPLTPPSFALSCIHCVSVRRGFNGSRREDFFLCLIPTARSTPSPGWTYCSDYNQSKCTYGCARLPPFLACRPDCFVFFPALPHLPRLFFCQAARIKKCSFTLSLSLAVQRHGKFPATGRGGKKNILFKIYSRMPLLSLTDLGQFGERHFFLSFFFPASLSITGKRLQLIIYSGVWRGGGEGLKLNRALSNCLNIS